MQIRACTIMTFRGIENSGHQNPSKQIEHKIKHKIKSQISTTAPGSSNITRISGLHKDKLLPPKSKLNEPNIYLTTSTGNAVVN
jgi:hypothetical protein